MCVCVHTHIHTYMYICIVNTHPAQGSERLEEDLQEPLDGLRPEPTAGTSSPGTLCVCCSSIQLSATFSVHRG